MAGRRLGLGFWSFVALMLALTALFAVLGVWQVERLAWKEALIADVTARVKAPAVPLPEATGIDGLVFHPVSVSGHYEPSGTVLVFTNLSDPKGPAGGAGYWVMTPLLTEQGVVFVNRGFVPQAEARRFKAGEGVSDAPVELSGLLVAPEAVGAFTPAPDLKGRIEWVRDPKRLQAVSGVAGEVYPATIDLFADPAGGLPQGGETVLDFPNNHLGYAMTWFGFALLTPGLLAAWIWQTLRRKQGAA